jgi:cytochrome c-type biogenesis protein CcmH/NrfG
VKALEVKADYFGMLNESKHLNSDYPHSALAHRLLADAYYYVGLLDDSIVAIKRAIDLDPSNPRGWNDLGVIYTDAGDTAKALGVYTHAIKIAPDDAKLLIDYAHIVSKSSLGVAKAALSHARQLLSENRGVDVESKVYALWADLIEGFTRLGDTSQAYECSLEAIRQQPDNWENWDAYASAALAMKKFGEVQPAVTRANQLDKTNAGRRYVTLGHAGLESENALLAIDAFRWAYTTRPNDPEVLAGLTVALCKKGRMTEQESNELIFCLRELNRVDPQRGKSIEDAVVQFLKARTGR